MTDAWDAPLSPGTCPWCSATNAPDARQCATCGAAIAQRDDLGGVHVPGVTDVDPNLLGQSSLASPLLRTQGTTNVLYATTQVNMTLGLAAAAAVLGQDAIKGFFGGNDVDLATVGRPSEAALMAAERLDAEREEGDQWSPDGPSSPSGAGPSAVPDPWADLPSG